MIDAFCSQAHYVPHVRPVFDAIPPHLRGRWYEGFDRPHGLGSPVLCASYSCYAGAGRRPVIMLEHGVGQVYEGGNPAYAGGGHRERVVLHLNPNDHTTAANAEAWPDVPSVTVGLPMLDRYAGLEVERSKVVAFSWHWRNRTARPVGAGDSAWPHFREHFPAQVEALHASGWTVLGHAHPRVIASGMQTNRRVTVHLQNWYGTMGVEWVPDFDDVLRRASVFAADTTSALWIAAALGLRTVLLDCPAYTKAKTLQLWPRFDPDASAIGPTVTEPSALASAVQDAYDSPPAPSFTLDLTVPFRDGRSAERAARTICEHVR